MPQTIALTRRRLLSALGLAVTLPALPRGLRAQEAREIVEMSLGQPDAPVTLVEYASLTCPHCARFHQSVLPQIKENFIETGKVRLVYRDVYFDGPGLWAAMMARCAGPERFFGVIDLLYKTQAEWTRAASAEEITKALYSAGRQAGLTEEEMDACMTDADFAKRLVAQYQKNAEADGIEATPTFILDGEKVENLPYEDFEARLNAALAG
jgi:protein-disulfide isomerase